MNGLDNTHEKPAPADSAGGGGMPVAETPVDARRLTPADIDRAVLQKGARGVLFATLGDFLSAVWDRDISFDEWLRRGVRVDFASGPQPDQATLEAIRRSWQQWRERHRRRRKLAGLVLSLAVLLAAFVLIATRLVQL